MGALGSVDIGTEFYHRGLRRPLQASGWPCSGFGATIDLMSLEPRLIHAPEFPPAEWLNAATGRTMGSLRGGVVLVDLWDFT